MTRFGEISLPCQNLKSWAIILIVQLSIWQNFLSCCASLYCWQWPNTEQKSTHRVTLGGCDAIFGCQGMAFFILEREREGSEPLILLSQKQKATPFHLTI